MVAPAASSSASVALNSLVSFSSALFSLSILRSDKPSFTAPTINSMM
jgi:hypothetical protein